MADEVKKGEQGKEEVSTKAEQSQEVKIVEKDVRQLLSEVQNKIQNAFMSPEKLEKMVKEVMEKLANEQKAQKESSVRKGEFAGIDAEDSGAKVGGRGSKLSSKFNFKHAMVGMVPKRFYKKHAEELNDLHDMNDELLIISKVLGKHPKELEMWPEYYEAAQRFASKALVSTTSGSGDEFVPTNFSAQVVDKVRLELKVAALHDRIPMTSNPYTVPLEGADATAVLANEASVEATEAGRITTSTPGTSNVTFTAQKLAVRTVFSEEISEDSIINILDYVRKKIAVALANGIENATINGDTTATHQDADVTSSTDVRKAWKGYRKLTNASAKFDAGGDALDAADLRGARKAMGRYGVNPKDLAWVVGINAYNQMLSEDDDDGFNDFRTLEKLGPQAIVLTGMLGMFDGIPVIVSEFVRENVGASGVYDGTNVGRTTINLVNRSRFWYGDRRLVTLKTFEDIQTDQMVMVIKQRLDFQPTESTSGNNLVASIIDILVN